MITVFGFTVYNERSVYFLIPLSSVQDNTEHLCGLYKSKDIPFIFELNKGNHFSDAAGCMARGIKWILERERRPILLRGAG